MSMQTSKPTGRHEMRPCELCGVIVEYIELSWDKTPDGMKPFLAFVPTTHSAPCGAWCALGTPTGLLMKDFDLLEVHGGLSREPPFETLPCPRCGKIAEIAQ